VVLGYAIFQPELVEQPALIAPLPTHHHPPPLLPIDQPPESRFAGLLKPFFDSIGEVQSFTGPRSARFDPSCQCCPRDSAQSPRVWHNMPMSKHGHYPTRTSVLFASDAPRELILRSAGETPALQSKTTIS
jgi:hypothetical protein